MDEKLNSMFTSQEKAEIIEAIEKMPVLPEGDVATFQVFVRWINRWSAFAHKVEEGYQLRLFQI